MKNQLPKLAALIIAVAAAGCGDETTAVVPRNAPVVPRPIAQVPAPAVPDPAAAWEAVQHQIDQADRESLAAIDRHVERVDAFFRDRKKGVPSFAQTVLGSEAQLRVGGSVVENSINALTDLLGQGKAFPEDSFKDFVTATFKQRVLDPDQLQRETRGAMAGWNADWRAGNARMLVRLKADMGENAFGQSKELLPSVIDPATSKIDAVVADTINTVGNDLVETIGKAVVSWIVGDVVTDMVTTEDDSPTKKFAINAGVSIAVDKAMGASTAEARLIGQVNAALESMRALIVDGKGSARPGLRQRLLSAHAERCLARRVALERFFSKGQAGTKIVFSDDDRRRGHR